MSSRTDEFQDVVMELLININIELLRANLIQTSIAMEKFPEICDSWIETKELLEKMQKYGYMRIKEQVK